MSAAAPSASTILATTTSRPSRPYWALGAVAVLVGLFVMAGSWIYLGPRSAPEPYFIVTFPAGSQGLQGQFWFVGATKEDVLPFLEGEPYTSMTGPFIRYVASDQDGQNANAIRLGGGAALAAYLLFGLLGFSARVRRLEAPLGRAGATFGKRLGATRPAKARSVLLVAAGAIASGLVTVAVVLAVEATLTSIGWGDWTWYDAPSWALVGWLVLPAVLSIGIVAVFALLLRRVRISAGVGAFLVGYGGLLPAGWVLAILSFGASCVTNPLFSNTGEVMPAACVANTFVNGLSKGSEVLGLAVLTLFCAIPAVGALLVYRDNRRRRAAPLEPRLTHVTP